jgi:hypothetical protein
LPKEGIVRGEVKAFSLKINLISKTRVKIEALISADPKIEVIPQSLIDFVTKKVRGFF